MSCYELTVGEKPPWVLPFGLLTPEEQFERMLIILAVVVVAVLLLKVIS
jgi:hypothetical protein